MTFDEHIREAEERLAALERDDSLTVGDRLGIVTAHTTIALAVFNRETMAKMHEAQATALAKLDD